MAIRYVAFLDILGFKNYVQNHEQEDVIRYIASFAHVIYDQWLKHGLGKKTNNCISAHVGNDIGNSEFKTEGLLVSDSLVLHTNDCTEIELKNLISYIKDVCAECFMEKIMLRGGLAKGEYDVEDMIGAYKLEKKVFGGEAYVRAVKLEGLSKTSAIIMDEETKEDMIRWKICTGEEIFPNLSDGREHYFILPWMKESFFYSGNPVNDENIRLYFDLAKESGWLPLYYNTLWYSVRKNEEKLRKLFIDVLALYYSNRNFKWSDVGIFIEHAKNDDVVEEVRYIISSLQLLGISGIKDGKVEIDAGKF